MSLLSPKTILSAVLWTGIWTGLWAAPPAPAQEGGKTTAARSLVDALPADTSLVIRVKNYAELEKKFKASPFYALREHPDVKRFLEAVDKKMEEGVAEARGKLGFNPLEIFSLCEGEIVLALGGLDKIFAAAAAGFGGGEVDIQPSDIPVIFSIDAGSKAPALREKLQKIFEFAQKEGAKKEVEDFRGGKIITLTDTRKGEKKGADGKKDKDKDKDDGDEGGGGGKHKDLEKVFFGDLGSRILVTISRPFLEQTMASLTSPGDEKLLTASADYQATLKEVNSQSDALVFLNLRPIAAAARKNLQANPIAGMVWGIIDQKILGKSLKNLGYTVTLRESDVQAMAFINNGGASDGLLSVLKGVAIPGRPNAIIPDDADEFASIAVNMPSLYAIILDIGNRVYALSQGAGGGGGEGANVEQQIEAMFGIKIKSVVEALGGAIHYYKKGGAAPDNPLGNITLGLELKDEMPVKELLGKLMMMAGGTQPQKYLDRDFYPLGAGGGDPDGAALAIADKLLVVGVKGDSVKDVIRRAGKGGKSLAESPAYQALAGGLAGGVPPQVVTLGYSSAKSFAEVLKLFKEASKAAGENLPLPDASVFADLLGGSIGYGLWKEQGLYSESIYAFKKGKAPPAK